MKHPQRSAKTHLSVVLDRSTDVSSAINASPINKISWLLEQLQKSAMNAPLRQNLNIEVLPSVLADLSGQTPSNFR